MKNNETIIRNLTVAQIVAAHAYFDSGKELASSKEITEKLLVGSGKSLSALASLQSFDPPLLLKYGKKSAREGALWAYNEKFGDRKATAKLIGEIIEKYKSAGVINEKNP